MPSIKLNQLVKQYAPGAKPAVNQLSLTIEDGEFMCLLGPSGCGKTTILRMIAGIEHASGGDIAIGDHLVDSIASGTFVPPEHRNIGLVFQSYALWPHMTVEENVDFGLRIQKMDKSEREAICLDVMKTLRIDQYADRYPSQLSGGQQQRVALARMLAVNPKVLLLDEPLSNLDATLRLEMRKELRRIHQNYGTTIVFVSHDQWEAMTLATSIAVINQGELQQVGTPDEIYARPQNRFVAEFIGNPNMNLIELLSQSGTEPSRLATILSGYPEAGNGTSCGIRPEDIRLYAEATGRTLSATIETIIPTGGSWVIEISCFGETLVHSTQLRPHWQEGQTVYCELPHDALHYFDGQGERVSAQPEQPTDNVAFFHAIPHHQTTATSHYYRD
ncbi:sn-glycerol-3-phosphate import ATP-binding protein UgpC [Vibrio aerogenes CECT 7868]|uniref:sn-glycerol-3-phosphate import ATP-binding protein UgpC n=1 Tax=Vibrio aerogenes CECT 7868 TaxID=1216006 RepID=A0A1M6A8G3_9VIBR|nr:ABC transporter ATP-binding protein [Vibrio aerogenes]SHI32729.1 sn-glycerol-3-phosphate import ATP-binding protein UgpC [Vibrio aerogenes CECT 7868]